MDLSFVLQLALRITRLFVAHQHKVSQATNAAFNSQSFDSEILAEPATTDRYVVTSGIILECVTVVLGQLI